MKSIHKGALPGIPDPVAALEEMRRAANRKPLELVMGPTEAKPPSMFKTVATAS